MSAIGKPLHLRLFLEGVEVPVISAQVQMGINSPAAASIQVIPHDAGLKLKPRTMVHLFYLDQRVIRTEEKGVTTNKTDRKLRDYKLLFAGEMVAYSYQQTPRSRGLVLQCADFSSYWDTAHITAVEYGPGGNAFTHTGALQGSNTSLADDIVSQYAQLLVSWLNQRPSTPGLRTVSGLAGGIIKILESIGGVPGISVGVNDFFTVSELRCKVLQQIIAEENDNTAYNLLARGVFDEWIRNGLSNAGQQATFRDMLKLLFQYVYYEVCPNPVARYSDAKIGTTEWKDVTYSTLLKTPEALKAKSLLDKTSNAAAMQVATSAADLSKWAETLDAFKKNLVSAKESLAALKAKNAKAGGDLSTVVNKVDESISELDVQRKTQPSKDWKSLANFVNLVQEAAKLLESAKGGGSTTKVPFSTSRSARLHTQIIRPDCWFAAAPLCNVVFPEQYVSFQYDRNFMGETTRVLVQLFNTLIGKDRLLATRILAPNFTDATKSLVKYVGAKSYRILMDHELHTGILPKEEWLPDTASGGASTPTEKAREQQAGLRMSWAERIALFHFFKYRFANRGAQVGGRFNPQLVVGFPAVVIRGPYVPLDGKKVLDSTDVSSDSAKAVDFILSNSNQLGAPTHIIGMIGSLSHSVSQDGGMTSFTINHARHHDGSDDEFLSVVKGSKTVGQPVKVKFNYNEIQKLKNEKDKKELLAFLVGCTPQGAKDTRPQEEWSARMALINKEADPSRAETQKALKPPPDYTNWTDVGGKKVLAPNPPGKVKRGSKGPWGRGDVLSIVVTNSTIVSVGEQRAFTEVVANIEQQIPTDNEIPTEEVLRPRSWFSPKYANDQVGPEIYQPFFGCNSVIDEMMVETGDAAKEDPSVAVRDGERATSAGNLNNYVHSISVSTNARLKHSIKRSVDFLAYTYGKVKSTGGSVDDFINQVTFREIATQEQVLGSDDLEFDVAANGKATVKKGNNGKVGFHTTAIHPELIIKSETIPLAGLTEDTALKLPRVTAPADRVSALGNYDVRKKKWDAVMDYYTALVGRRAFRG